MLKFEASIKAGDSHKVVYACSIITKHSKKSIQQLNCTSVIVPLLIQLYLLLYITVLYKLVQYDKISIEKKTHF